MDCILWIQIIIKALSLLMHYCIYFCRLLILNLMWQQESYNFVTVWTYTVWHLYLGLIGKLWGIFCVFIEDKWSQSIKSLLYLGILSHAFSRVIICIRNKNLIAPMFMVRYGTFFCGFWVWFLCFYHSCTACCTYCTGLSEKWMYEPHFNIKTIFPGISYKFKAVLSLLLYLLCLIFIMRIHIPIRCHVYNTMVPCFLLYRCFFQYCIIMGVNCIYKCSLEYVKFISC